MSNPDTESTTVLDVITERRELVNEAIPEDLPIEEPERLYEASRYLLEAGGKRLRPTMLLLAAEAVADVSPGSTSYREFPVVNDHVDIEDTVAIERGEGRPRAVAHQAQGRPAYVDIMAGAVAVEIIQSFTLIHDDIMDDDPLRRGVPAVHREYDLDMAILSGDTLYSKAFEIMLGTGATSARSVRALDVLARTCTEICEGQAMDVEFESRGDVTIEEYMEMVELKTAVLYAASASIPAILLGASQDVVDSLYAFGRNVGIGFQIQDDVLDLTVPSDKLGKQRGSDLIENKRTLITLHAREQGVDVESLIEADSPDDVTEADIEQAVGTLEDAGSIEFARSRGTELVEDGKAELATLPENESRTLLEDIADYLIDRDY